MRNNILKSLVLGLLTVNVAVLTGCFTSNDTSKEASLSISMGLQDVDKGGALNKGSTIRFSKLIVTMVSNATVPDTIRDTITPGNNGFVSTATDTQSVAKSYSVKPLRSWTISVQTVDLKDSVIHSASTVASKVLVGETRAVTLNLTSRFVMYVAKFVLPDSLRASGTSDAQKLNINRFLMIIDGDTVVDSTKPVGYFAATPTVHNIEFDYIKADTTHELQLYIFGVIPGWPANKPLFGDTITVAKPGSGPDTTYTPTLPWKGPGSPDDPAYVPGNPGGANADLTIHIGKVGTVFFEPIVNETVYKRQ